MKKGMQINPQVLLTEAGNSEHKEAYRILDKTKDYRIGAGVRIEQSNQLSFFLEALIYLCPDHVSVNMPLLERKLEFLKELKERGYSICCQDSNCIACEIIVSPQNMVAEYEAITLMTEKIRVMQGEKIA